MLVTACIAPHGGELIPALAQGNLERMAVTRASMEELGRRFLAAKPDTIVVLTPHGTQVAGCVTVGANELAAGSLDSEDGARVSADFPVDLGLVEALLNRAAERDVPILPLAFADEDRNPLPFQLDWGAFIPLWFMGAKWEKRPEIVVLCPSRALPRTVLIDSGRVIAEVCAESERRVALICSADQGHGHDESGPYGFATDSAEYDAAYIDAVRANQLDRLLEWEDAWIGCAMTDSFWQTLMLHGAMLHTRMRAELLSYEAPTYFGMAVAACERA